MRQVESASLQRKSELFQKAIVALYDQLFPDNSTEDFDHFRFGDVPYVRVYDLIQNMSN